MISASWEDSISLDNPWCVWHANIKKCDSKLMTWHKTNFKNAAKEIVKLKAELQLILNQDQKLVGWEVVK